MLSEMIMDLEVTEQIHTGKYERNPQRCTQRNGYSERLWDTMVGEIPLRIPKLRSGSCFPSLLEPRRRSEKALLAVVQQANIKGVNTRKVEDLHQALGLTGIGKSKVSCICKELDEVVSAFRDRSLNDAFWLQFLLRLKERGLHGVRLVNSDAHQGLIKGLSQTMSETSWQRCRVHFMRCSIHGKLKPIL